MWHFISPEFGGLKTAEYLPKPEILIHSKHFHMIIFLYILALLANIKAENSAEGPFSAQSSGGQAVF